LRRHGIDDSAPALEPREPLAQLAGDPLSPQESPEVRKAPAAGQARIAIGDSNASWVRANDAPAAPIPIAALAAERVPAHLMDARRGRGLHAWSLAETTTTALKFRPFACSRGGDRWPTERVGREIHV